MKRSLRNKIITWSFVPTAIILVIVALVSLYTYQRVTEDLVIERDRELTRLSASLLATDLAAYTDPLSDQFLAVADGIVMFDERGVVLAEPEQYEQWQPAWFKNIIRRASLSSSKAIFSDIVTDELQGEKLIVVVIPTRNRQGEPTGGIAGLFRLDPTGGSALYRSIEKIRRSTYTCLYLVDGNGRVIYHSTTDYIGKDFSTQMVVEMVQNGWAGAYRTHDLDGRDIVASFAPVPGTSWGLVTEESWAALTESSRRYEQLLLLLLVLVVAVPASIVTVGVRRITRPISELIHAAQQIADGRFGHRITASTGDELEELAKQFNRMANQLQESYADLEQKVADRTRELATLNNIAAEVSQSLDLAEILNNALENVLEVMEIEKGLAFRLEEESETLILMAHRGLERELDCDISRLPLGATVARRIAEDGKPAVQLVADYPEGELRQLLDREWLLSVISIPLMAQGRIVGAIILGARALRSPTPEELSLLAAIGHQIGVAVENAQLYEQAQQLAIVRERNRLARDLHDSVTQALYGVTLYAEAAARQLGSGDAQRATSHLREIRNTAQESLREMRLFIFELRLPTLKKDGLAAALQARLEAVESRVGLETTFKLEGDGKLSPEIEEGLYRIAQEALNNALRHAHAQSISVYLQWNQQTITLEIADDGIGFDPRAAREQGGFGLRGMEERAVRLGGRLQVQSSPARGTKIRAEVCR